MTYDYPVFDMLDGHQSPRVSATPWAVPPAIGLDAARENLVWTWGHGDINSYITPPAKLLEGFLRLHNAPPPKVLAYARKCGVLAGAVEKLREYEIGQHATGDGWIVTEPIVAWHRLAAEAREIAYLAAALRGFGHAREPLPGTRLNMVLDLQARLNRWLEIGAVRPSVQLHPDWTRVEGERALLPTVGASGLFGQLALELALAGTGSAGLAMCASCGEWFVPAFAPRKGERQWCPAPQCKKAMRAAATRASRARNRRRELTAI